MAERKNPQETHMKNGQNSIWFFFHWKKTEYIQATICQEQKIDKKRSKKGAAVSAKDIGNVFPRLLRVAKSEFLELLQN